MSRDPSPVDSTTVKLATLPTCPTFNSRGSVNTVGHCHQNPFPSSLAWLLFMVPNVLLSASGFRSRPISITPSRPLNPCGNLEICVPTPVLQEAPEVTSGWPLFSFHWALLMRQLGRWPWLSSWSFPAVLIPGQCPHHQLPLPPKKED